MVLVRETDIAFGVGALKREMGQRMDDAMQGREVL